MQVDEEWRVGFQSWELGPRLVLDYGSSSVPVGALLSVTQKAEGGWMVPTASDLGGGKAFPPC